MNQIVKRNGHTEPFDERKVYASIYAVCLSLRVSDGTAELIAESVTDEVKEHLTDGEISARQLHLFVVDRLKHYNPAAAYLYDTHKDIS